MRKEQERIKAEFEDLMAGVKPKDPVRHMLLVLGFVPANQTVSSKSAPMTTRARSSADSMARTASRCPSMATKC